MRARLEPFAMTGSSLADVFDQPMREPIPDRLLAVITAGSRRAPAARERQVRPTEQQATGVFDAIAEALFPRGLGFAGAFTLTALVRRWRSCGLSGQQWRHASLAEASRRAQEGDLVAAGDLKVALETQPSLDDETAIRSGAPLWPASVLQEPRPKFLPRIQDRRQKAATGSRVSPAAAQMRSGIVRRSHAEASTAGAPERLQARSVDPESPAVDAVVDKTEAGRCLRPRRRGCCDRQRVERGEADALEARGSTTLER